MRAGAGVHGVEERHAQVLGDAEARERPRQLEAACETAAGALVRGEPVHGGAIEAHGARLVAQRAADAVDQRRLAGAVRANEAEPLAGLDRQVDAVERHEAAEAFADVVDLEQRSHGVLLPAAGSRSRSTRPQPRQIASASAETSQSQDGPGMTLSAAPMTGSAPSQRRPTIRPRANARYVMTA